MTFNNHPHPVRNLLRAEIMRPGTVLPWQLALGQVMEQLPPFTGGDFQTGARPELNIAELPPWVREAWSQPFNAHHQIELTYVKHPFWEPGEWTLKEERNPSRWWTRPELMDGSTLLSLHTTSGPWLGAPCVEAFGTEDSFFDPWPGGVDKMKWRRIIPEFEPRVYEVHSAAAWSHLVEAHPSLISDGRPPRRNSLHRPLTEWFPGRRLYEPDWRAVAERFDVIHLTQLAYLECAYDAIPCLDGVTTVTGWGPDVAVWLKSPISLGE